MATSVIAPEYVPHNFLVSLQYTFVFTPPTPPTPASFIPWVIGQHPDETPVTMGTTVAILFPATLTTIGAIVGPIHEVEERYTVYRMYSNDPRCPPFVATPHFTGEVPPECVGLYSTRLVREAMRQWRRVRELCRGSAEAVE
jgi:hypothetical protein